MAQRTLAAGDERLSDSVISQESTALEFTAPSQGLDEQEVLRRRERGDGNNIRIQTGRTYQQILQQNVFTFINIVLFSIGIVLVLFGLWGDAFVSVGVVALNVIVSVIQEFRAKAKLDQIALLTRPQVSVIREGAEKIIDPSELVIGDIIVAKPGDQIVVDGVCVGDGRMDVDESLLTGESDLVIKTHGMEVFSGSFCVTGSVRYQATKVGAESFANKLTIAAREFNIIRTPLQNDINFVVRILLVLATIIGLLFGVSVIIREVETVRSVQMAAVIAGLVPAGLVLMTATAYAMGSLRMSGRGALIQQSNAVESMSNVNVLCLDKTGTLTANKIHLHTLHPLNISKEAFSLMLGTYAKSTRAGNRTSDALGEGCEGVACDVVDEIPFSSARKWSAIAFDHDDLRGVYVLGAPEMLMPYLDEGVDIAHDMIHAWTNEGLRVLMVIYSPEPVALHDENDDPILPDGLRPLGIVSFSDELRAEAKETLAGFMKAGINLKIISGDNPHTVAALAKQAGLSQDIQVVSGTELARMEPSQIAEIAEQKTVFGRITPEQKEMLVDSLRKRGFYVAMIGDGVNDVLSLKKAHIGISMQSGSAATRGVADIILLNDSFKALPAAFMEGQRILNGMEDIIRLFLTRAFYAALIILGVAVVADVIVFPFIPKHASLITLLTVGFPTFGLAAWARAGVPKRNQIASSMSFVFPAALTMAFTALAIYFAYLAIEYVPAREAINNAIVITPAMQVAEREAIAIARSALTSIIVFMGLLLIPFVEPPTKWWVAGDDFSGDWRPTIIAGLMFLTFVVIVVVEPFHEFFEISPLNLVDYVLIAATAVLWGMSLRMIWKLRLFERFFGLEIPLT
ncbi:MAG: HAD-IC family P-type ATPase [Aggregatilineales bacterium]